MVGYPLLGYATGLSDAAFGLFAGAGVHDSAQAIASGFLYSQAAGEAATVVKLTRTVFLIPVVLVLGFTRRGAGGSRTPRGLAGAVPWFALGFVALAVVRSAGDAIFGDAAAWATTVAAGGEVATFLIVVAMAAIGLSTDLGRLRRIGPKPFAVGFAAAVAVGAVALSFALAV